MATMQIKQDDVFYNKSGRFGSNRGREKVFQKQSSQASESSKGKDKHFYPFDRYGKVSCCIIFDSKMHWAEKCPHNKKIHSVNLTEGVVEVVESVEDEFEEINVVPMTEEVDKNEIFVAEASKAAVVDTACTKTVTGEK